MQFERLTGLTAAVATPMKANGEVNPRAIDRYASFLYERGIRSVFVNGTTGESLLLSTAERKLLAEKWMEHSSKLRVVVHVGSTSWKEAQELAAHAEAIGARAISAMGPCFLPAGRAEELVAFNALIAAKAPYTPYYYYHIPDAARTFVYMPEFLRQAGAVIPNLAGVKYTSFDTNEQQRCIGLEGGRYDILHGHDETLVSGLQLGSTGGIGTSYNITSPEFQRLYDDFMAGKADEAVRRQYKVNEVVDLLGRRINCIVGVKAALDFAGIEAGPCRLPVRKLSRIERRDFERELAPYAQWLGF
ncbi:MAG: dihydrodipicolinate synthase family protein [Bacteroidales bacterium]|nr:dihydrodipicolinate synthase family protein [Bacteroidales bacterium]